MDDKGYAFTPLAFLIMIPVIILAISYGSIVDELGKISSISIGGDVTAGTVTNIYQAIEKGASDSGRNATFTASKTAIDSKQFIPDSKMYIRKQITDDLNNYVITVCRQIEAETGREIFINNIPINNYTNATFTVDNVNIEQTDPFGYYVVISAGIPIKITQKDQTFEAKTPEIKSFVTLTGVEDPYIWIKSKYLKKNIIYQYPFADNFGIHTDYHFLDNLDDVKNNNIRANPQQLYNCLNGTDNPGGLSPQPYYIPDPNGLTFFERLEGSRDASVTDDPGRMATFIIGDPLSGEYSTLGYKVSAVDYEYFNKVRANYKFVLGNGRNTIDFKDPDGSVFYLTTSDVNQFGLIPIRVSV